MEAAAPRGPKDANNDVNSITRSEFMELLVRIAAVGLTRSERLNPKPQTLNPKPRGRAQCRV